MSKSKSNLSSSSPSSSHSCRVRVSTMHATTPDWTSLPDHLVPLIAQRLHTRIDTFSLRAVCRTFQSLVPPPSAPLFPLSSLKICFPVLKKGLPRRHLVLAQSTIYAVEPLHKITDEHQTTKIWLLRVKESNSRLVQLEDPLTGRPAKNYTRVLPRYLSLLSYRVKEITKIYRLELVGLKKATSRRFNNRKPPFCQKVVASPCLDETGNGFAIMAMYGGVKKPGLWRKVDQKWTEIDIGKNDYVEDIVYHNEKFYAVGYNGGLIMVDSKSLTVTQLMESGRGDKCIGFGAYYLVKSLKDLYVVVKGYRNHIRVYKFDENKLEWVKVVGDLDDRVLFVSKSCSYSVSAQEFHLGCKGNCVYFEGDIPYCSAILPDRPGKYACIFDLDDGTTAPLSDIQGYSKIFWPPPTWLKDLPDYLYPDFLYGSD